MIDTTLNYSLADNISFSEVDDEMVLLNLNTGSYFGLNAVGAEVINLLIEKKSCSQITQILTGKYDVDATVIKQDVIGLIQQFLDNKLILVD